MSPWSRPSARATDQPQLRRQGRPRLPRPLPAAEQLGDCDAADEPGLGCWAFMLGPLQRSSGGLLRLTGWQQLPVTTAIHCVQVNADPNHYAGSRPAPRDRPAGRRRPRRLSGRRRRHHRCRHHPLHRHRGCRRDQRDWYRDRPCPFGRLHARGMTNPPRLRRRPHLPDRADERRQPRLGAAVHGPGLLLLNQTGQFHRFPDSPWR
jgi:hypothetical protein